MRTSKADLRLYVAPDGTAHVFLDVPDLQKAKLGDLPPDIVRTARYIEAVNPADQSARVLKNTMGAQGWIERTTEPGRIHR